MLVLTRKQNEEIQIGHDIVIKVISTGRGKVKLGIEAPAEVRVLRGELEESVKATRLATDANQTEDRPLAADTFQARVKQALKKNAAAKTNAVKADAAA